MQVVCGKHKLITMAILCKCPTCGHGISINAYRCPRCGENDFKEYYTYYTEVQDRCSYCNGTGAIKTSYDPLKSKTNLLGNGGHDTYNPVYQKLRQENPIEYTSHICSKCKGYGYTIRQIKSLGIRDKRLGY